MFKNFDLIIAFESLMFAILLVVLAGSIAFGAYKCGFSILASKLIFDAVVVPVVIYILISGFKMPTKG